MNYVLEVLYEKNNSLKELYKFYYNYLKNVYFA